MRCSAFSSIAQTKTRQGDVHIGIIAQSHGAYIRGLSSRQGATRAGLPLQERHMQPAWRPFRVPTRDFVEGGFRLKGDHNGCTKRCRREKKGREPHGNVSIGIACYASRLSAHTQRRERKKARRAGELMRGTNDDNNEGERRASARPVAQLCCCGPSA